MPGTRSLKRMLKMELVKELLEERQIGEQKDKQLAKLRITIEDLDKLHEEEDDIILKMEEEMDKQKLLHDQLHFVSNEQLTMQLEKIAMENRCSICLCPWEAKNYHRLVSLKCGHLFGELCIRTHLQLSNVCPICREIADGNDVRRVLLNDNP
ncbi:E3 ubiquitin-protein ligase RNF8 isoform X1 [Drosophila erecta]|uniref:E3 ubiquitin-protein ligase RNF8 isoform X1 n=1 Tax=Drosophila erecta TaxID=7220 RepID=UPI000F0453D8|nr:E3 ubiquitin-protein ligase RNF8 isoform X1 [Drosophila erecta]